jgi:hypothetical protein
MIMRAKNPGCVLDKVERNSLFLVQMARQGKRSPLNGFLMILALD